MPLAIALTVGAVGGLLLGRKKAPKAAPPAPAPTPTPAPTTAAQQVAATQPPDVTRDTSEAVKAAMGASVRRRRRATAGGAGRVSTGPLTAGQSSINAASLPRTLIGG